MKTREEEEDDTTPAMMKLNREKIDGIQRLRIQRRVKPPLKQSNVAHLTQLDFWDHGSQFHPRDVSEAMEFFWNFS